MPRFQAPPVWFRLVGVRDSLRESRVLVSQVDQRTIALEGQVGTIQNFLDQRFAELDSRLQTVERTLDEVARGLRNTQFRRVGGRTITWLHFSDLHLCQPRTGWDSNQIIKSLQEDLEQMKGKGLQPDLVFFTGDAVFGHIKSEGGWSITDQFAQARRLFQTIMGMFPNTPPQNFFIVPGNHDVNRQQIPSMTTDWLDGLEKDSNGLQTIHTMIHCCNLDWQTCMRRLEDYRSFLKVSNYDHLIQEPERLVYGLQRLVRDCTVGIVGLNSAWSSSRDGEKGRLWLGGHWQIQTQLQKMDGIEIKIGLIHHPLNWFVKEEDSNLEKEIEREFNFWLHGREHDNWVTPIGDRHVRIAAGASYGATDGESGYNFVRLNVDEGTADVWLRCYKDGGWIPCIVYGKTDDNGVWSLKNLKFASTPKSSAP